MENSTTNEAPPKTPSTEPSVEPEEDIEYEDMGMAVMGIEHVQLYNAGGYHPVHLDDILISRFEVVHKLGSGGFGIVWLCRDLKLGKWRAVKIIVANRSSDCAEKKIYDRLRNRYTLEELEEHHITVPLEEFWIEGPNGRHLCLVMPVHGSTVASWRMSMRDWQEGADTTSKNVCSQIIKAVGLLHREGICHGDLRPDNILMKLEGIDGLNKEQVLNLMGEHDLYEIGTVSGNPPGPRAPEYCVVRAESDWCETMSTKSITIVDFGESFFIDNPPKTTGIPNLYAAPEIMFEDSGIPGLYSDIWSLACTLFEVRTNEPLLYSYIGGSSLPIAELELYVGLLPPVYGAAYSKMLGEYLRKYRRAPSAPAVDHEAESNANLNSTEDGDKFADQDDDDQHKNIDKDNSLYENKDEDDEDKHESESEKKLRHRREEFTEGSGYSDVLEARLGEERQVIRKFQDPKYLPPDDGSEYIKWQYSRKEVVELADLLRKMLKYDPSERISMDTVISHPWVGSTTKDGFLGFQVEDTKFCWTRPSCTFL